jgi:hypothetical protein
MLSLPGNPKKNMHKTETERENQPQLKRQIYAETSGCEICAQHRQAELVSSGETGSQKYVL